jgi:aminocarboxymuconate-semialdehyde decarboxylase
VRVIDSHFHWYPRSIYERLADQAGYPRAVRVEDGFTYWYAEDEMGGNRGRIWLDLEGGFAASDAASGVETTVVNTTGTFAGLLDQLPRRDAVEVARLYNDEVAKMQQLHPGRFYGTASVPLQDTDEAISIAEHAIGQLGLYAINLPSVTRDEPIDVPRLEAFYARVEELGVPIIIHPTDVVFGSVLEGYDGAMNLTIGRLLDSSITVLRLIFSGIMARYPRLRIVQTHAGALLPYQAGRTDKNVYKSKKITSLPHTPSEYLKQIFVDTVAPQELTIQTALQFYGPLNVMYGTDFPCWMPDKAMRIIRGAELTSEELERVLHRNAELVFKLPKPANVVQTSEAVAQAASARSG